MNSKYDGKWTVSADEEAFHLLFDSEAEAIAEGHAGGVYPFWVGECFSPPSPEMLWYAGDWIEEVQESEDYCYEGNCGVVFEPTPEQRDELESLLRPVIREWLKRHNLEPDFFVIDGDTYRQINGPEAA